MDGAEAGEAQFVGQSHNGSFRRQPSSAAHEHTGPEHQELGFTKSRNLSTDTSEIQLAHGRGSFALPRSSSETFSVNRRDSACIQMDELKHQVLEDMPYRLSSAPSDSIQRRKKAILNQMQDSKRLRAENIFQSDQPLAMFLTSGRTPTYLLLLSCIVALLEFLFAALTATQLWSAAKYENFRFVPLQLRNGSVPATPGIVDYHLLFNGCMQRDDHVAVHAQGNTLVKSFPHPITANGFVVISGSPPNSGCSPHDLGHTPYSLSPPPPPHVSDGFPRPTTDMLEEIRPVAFRVEGSHDQREWRTVASSTWAYNGWLEAVMMDGALSSSSVETLMEFDLRPPVALVLFRTALPACKFVLHSAGLVLVLRGKAVLAVSVLVSSFLFAAAVALVCAVAVHYTAAAASTFLPWVTFAFSLCAFLALRFQQRKSMIIVALSSSLVVVATVVDVTLISKTQSFWTDIPFTMLLIFFVGLRWVGYYRSLLKMAISNIAEDKEKYNRAWKEYVEGLKANDAGELHALTEVNNLLGAVKEEVVTNYGSERPMHRVYFDIGQRAPFVARADAGNGHHLSSEAVGSGAEDPERDKMERMRRMSSWKAAGSFVRNLGRRQSSASGAGPEGSLKQHFEEVSDLDQLYNQARGVQPFFRDKVWQWASSAEAMLPVSLPVPAGGPPELSALHLESSHEMSASGSYVEGVRDSIDRPINRWAAMQHVIMRRHRHSVHVQGGERTYVPVAEIADSSAVAWTELKDIDRTIHKVRRVYGDRASRAVDVVRERIVLRKASHLYECLWSVLEDSDIDVRGVKNGLRDSFNPDWSAGFRAVILSLSVQNSVTKDLALAQHVCELQLVLEPIMKVQTSCNHRAYIIFREARSLKAASPFSNLYYSNRTTATSTDNGQPQDPEAGQGTNGEHAVPMRRTNSAVTVALGLSSRFSVPRRMSMMSTLSGQISPARGSTANMDLLRLKRNMSTGSMKTRRWLQASEDKKIELTRMDDEATFSRSLLVRDDDDDDPTTQPNQTTAQNETEVDSASSHLADDFTSCPSQLERSHSEFGSINHPPRRASHLDGGASCPGSIPQGFTVRGLRPQGSARSVAQLASPLPPTAPSPAGAASAASGSAGDRSDSATMDGRSARLASLPSDFQRPSSTGWSSAGMRTSSSADQRKFSWPRHDMGGTAQAGAQRFERSAGVSSLPSRIAENYASAPMPREVENELACLPSAFTQQFASLPPGPHDASRLPSDVSSGTARRGQPTEVLDLSEDPPDPSRRVLASPLTLAWRQGVRSALSERRARQSSARRSRGSLQYANLQDFDPAKASDGGAAEEYTKGREGDSMAPTPSGHSQYRLSERRRTPASARKGSLASLEMDFASLFRRRTRRKGIVEPEVQDDSHETALRKLFLSAVKTPGGVLDAELRKGTTAAMHGASLISGFFTSSPIAYTVGLARIQLFLFAIAVLLVVGAVHPVRLMLEQGLEEITALRFEALELRNGSAAATAGSRWWDVGGMRKVGLLRDGCEAVHFLNANCSLDGAVFEQRWDPPVRANGWFIAMEAAPEGADAIRQFAAVWTGLERSGEFEDECLVGNEDEGTDDDKCVGVFGGADADGVLPSDIIDANNVTERVFKFDKRPLLHKNAWALIPLFKAVGFLAAAVCGMSRMGQRAVWWLAGGHWVAAVALAVTAITLGPTDDGNSVWPYWTLHAVLCLAFGCSLMWLQRHAVALQGLEAAGSLLLHVLFYLSGEKWQIVVPSVLADAVLGAVCGCLAVLRRRVLTTSERLIQKDKLAYDEEWESVLRGHSRELDELKDLVSTFPRSTTEAPRQRMVLVAAACGESDARGAGSRLSPLSSRQLHSGVHRLKSGESSATRKSAERDGDREQGPHRNGNGGTDAHGDGGNHQDQTVVGVSGGETSDQQAKAGRSFGRLRRGNSREFSERLRSLVLPDNDTWRGEASNHAHMTETQEWMDMMPVRSLDQIFAQAKALHFILKSKAQQWAKYSNGMVRRKGGSYRAWTEQDSSDAVWASVKKPERAIEKVLRSYGGDASRLVDVCRQALVFTTVGDLVRCLEQVQQDGQVRVLRVKNRLDKQYDSALSAGYRDVAMNLVVCTDRTRRLAVDCHVCELQLILQGFAELKSNEGHKRYVTFRNKRAE